MPNSFVLIVGLLVFLNFIFQGIRFAFYARGLTYKKPGAFATLSIVGAVLALGYAAATYSSELEALAYAAPAIIAGYLLWFITTLVLMAYGYRESHMDQLYAEYERLSAEGKKPCIVHGSITGPYVVPGYPRDLENQTNIDAWTDKDGMHVYRTLSHRRFTGKAPSGHRL